MHISEVSYIEAQAAVVYAIEFTLENQSWPNGDKLKGTMEAMLEYFRTHHDVTNTEDQV